MKKQLLFVIDSLGLGGAEKSLVTLLNLFDYSKYDVDLIVFARGGAFEELLPKEVNILPVPDFFQYTSIPWKKFLKKCCEPGKLFAQLRYSIKIRSQELTHAEKAIEFWQYSAKSFSTFEKEYDVAIAYAQGMPTFFVMDKVNAKRKAAWVNIIYKPEGKHRDFAKEYYRKYDMINAVSEEVAEQIKETFDLPLDKVMCQVDILDVNLAKKMALLPSNAKLEMALDGIKILTVGRLAKMKGYHLAIEAARILKERGLDFSWYVIGDGELREELLNQIEQFGLSNLFVLLGGKANPYPYFANCDYYVQTSLYEGFGITLAEAKMFNKPIVSTNFNTAHMNITSERNGLLVDINAEAIADGIIRMISDDMIKEKCVHNLQNEVICNTEEIEKLYKWIDNN